MESDDSGDRERRAARPHSHLFTVRLWKEEVAGGSEYRGSVGHVISGAFHNFRDWSELVAFILARMEEEERAQPRRFARRPPS
jgi:hypothetical protein